MKKYLLLLLIAVCAVSCKDKEPDTPFEKTYMMQYVDGDYSETVEVKMKVPGWLNIDFIANGEDRYYSAPAPNIIKSKNKYEFTIIDNIRIKGEFYTNGNKSSYVECRSLEEDELIWKLIEVQ